MLALPHDCLTSWGDGHDKHAHDSSRNKTREQARCDPQNRSHILAATHTSVAPERKSPAICQPHLHRDCYVPSLMGALLLYLSKSEGLIRPSFMILCSPRTIQSRPESHKRKNSLGLAMSLNWNWKSLVSLQHPGSSKVFVCTTLVTLPAAR